MYFMQKLITKSICFIIPRFIRKCHFSFAECRFEKYDMRFYKYNDQSLYDRNDVVKYVQ